MTAILRNDGEIGALSPENGLGFSKQEFASKMADPGAKNNSIWLRNGMLLHGWQHAEILITLGFFAFAKIF